LLVKLCKFYEHSGCPWIMQASHHPVVHVLANRESQ
jgi:hypothetical protein